MQGWVGVGGLVDAVGVARAVGRTGRDDEDAVRSDLGQEGLKDETVARAACLAPDDDGELEVRRRLGWGVDCVVREAGVGAVDLWRWCQSRNLDHGHSTRRFRHTAGYGPDPAG